jgi:hypothetical protein
MPPSDARLIRCVRTEPPHLNAYSGLAFPRESEFPRNRVPEAYAKRL